MVEMNRVIASMMKAIQMKACLMLRTMQGLISNNTKLNLYDYIIAQGV